jgi:tRNA 2-thiocytidine biosynthesis protein TtcA
MTQADAKMKDKIRRLAAKCIADFSLISEGDKILVAVSGGKDSSILALTLQELMRRAPVRFSLHALLIDQKQPGFNAQAYLDWMERQGMPVEVLNEDTYSVVVQKTERGKSYCGLCSRLRRGILYTYAERHGFNKVALGHHRDDLNETLLMNMFFNGKIATMPPLVKAKGKPIEVIRPFAYVPEEDLKDLASLLQIPVIPCNLCSNQAGMVRAEIKSMLTRLYVKHPQAGQSLLHGMSNVKMSRLLAAKSPTPMNP